MTVSYIIFNRFFLIIFKKKKKNLAIHFTLIKLNVYIIQFNICSSNSIIYIIHI